MARIQQNEKHNINPVAETCILNKIGKAAFMFEDHVWLQWTFAFGMIATQMASKLRRFAALQPQMSL